MPIAYERLIYNAYKIWTSDLWQVIGEIRQDPTKHLVISEALIKQIKPA